MVETDSSSNSIAEEMMNVNITIGKNQHLKLIDSTNVTKVGFEMHGNGISKGSFNYTKELLKMGADEAFLFDLIMDSRMVPNIHAPFIKSNYSQVDSSKLTKRQKKQLYEGYKTLSIKKLVVRVARGKYLINPKLVVTDNEMYQSLVTDWETIMSGNKVKWKF